VQEVDGEEGVVVVWQGGHEQIEPWTARLGGVSDCTIGKPASPRGSGSIVAARESPFMTADGPRLRVVTLIVRLVQVGTECLAVEITTRLHPRSSPSACRACAP
jgi:hypothetical protein